VRAIVLTSNSRRHIYFAQIMASYFDLSGVILEPKKDYYEHARRESEYVRNHFEKLTLYERDFFGSAKWPSCQKIELDKARVNDPEVVDWAIKKKPEVILLFGTAILKDGWLCAFKDNIINIHLGMSPFYRGSATLFWPFFNDEIEFAGATIHIAAKKVDAGDILARIRPDLEPGDTYYSINYKTIKKGIDMMPGVVMGYKNGSLKPSKQDITLSKVYKKADFNEDTLRAALAVLGEGLTPEKLEIIEQKVRCDCL